MSKAIVLLSGGMDSTTALSIAIKEGFECYVLTLDYGQRHQNEINSAKNIVKDFDIIEHKMLSIDLTVFGGSALTDGNLKVPEKESSGIPIPDVPARNTIFFSLALAWAEVVEADAIFSGVNAVDYSGYPDCRPEYISAVQDLFNLATKITSEGKNIEVRAPLINMDKKEIIKIGIENGIDFSKTVSCYQLDHNGKSCGLCDSCRIRSRAFKELSLEDNIEYV